MLPCVLNRQRLGHNNHIHTLQTRSGLVNRIYAEYCRSDTKMIMAHFDYPQQVVRYACKMSYQMPSVFWSTDHRMNSVILQRQCLLRFRV